MPSSLNALVNACNQKNNRDPVMNLDEDTVRRALDTLQQKRLAGPTSSGYLNAYPGSESSPGTSISDFAAGSNVATDTIVNTANSNDYVIGNVSGSANNIIIVATGYFD